MQYEIKNLPKGKIEITATIDVEELTPHLEEAAKRISKEVKIQGFRPGNAPYDIVKKHVGEMDILNEASQAAIQKTYISIIKKEKLEVVGSPEVSIKKMAPGNPLEFIATVAKVPPVEIGDYTKISVTEREVSVSEEKVNSIIDDLRKQRASETLEKKAAELGDKVEIDFDVFVDNVPIDGGSAKKYSLLLGEGQFIPGFEDNVVGMNAEEEKAFTLSFPKEYGAKHLAGKAAEFKVRVHGVYKRSLPELNDEFAKNFGMDSAEKLTDQIRMSLEDEDRAKRDQAIELEIIDELVKKSTIGDIPDILVNSEVNKMVQELESNILQQGLRFEDYLKQLKKTMDQLKLEIAPQAVHRVRAMLVTRALFFKEGFSVSEEELAAEVERTKELYAQNQEALNQLESTEYREYLRNVIGNSKVMNLLKTACVKHNKKEHDHEHCDHDHGKE